MAYLSWIDEYIKPRKAKNNFKRGAAGAAKRVVTYGTDSEKDEDDFGEQFDSSEDEALSPSMVERFNGPSPLSEEDAMTSESGSESDVSTKKLSEHEDSQEPKKLSGRAKSPEPKKSRIREDSPEPKKSSEPEDSPVPKKSSGRGKSPEPKKIEKKKQNPIKRRRERTRTEERRRIENEELETLKTIAKAAKASTKSRPSEGEKKVEEKKDAFDTFGVYVANKLRRLSEKLDEEDIEMLEHEITSSIASRYASIKRVSFTNNFPNQIQPPQVNPQQWPNMVFPGTIPITPNQN